MSGVRFRGATGAISTGTTEKTLFQITAASNHGILIEELSISFNGADPSAAPILVEIARQTSAGTMSSLTPVKDPDDSDETLQVTMQHTATSEPTKGDVLAREYVHPQTGYTMPMYGKPTKIGGGDRIGVIVTAPASVNAVVRTVGEE